MVLFRVWLNRLWFEIHNKILNFHDCCYNELFHDNRRKWKSVDLSMDLWQSNNIKVTLPNFAKDHCFWTLWTLNSVDCIPFSCTDYFQILFSNLRKTWKFYQRMNESYKISPVHQSICLSICHLSVCDAFSSESTQWIFKFFCMRIFCHILKSDKVIIWKIVFIF